jgi:hypothetical protein
MIQWELKDDDDDEPVNRMNMGENINFWQGKNISGRHYVQKIGRPFYRD